jgi:hypothetical protein
LCLYLSLYYWIHEIWRYRTWSSKYCWLSIFFACVFHHFVLRKLIWLISCDNFILFLKGFYFLFCFLLKRPIDLYLFILRVDLLNSMWYFYLFFLEWIFSNKANRFVIYFFSWFFVLFILYINILLSREFLVKKLTKNWQVVRRSTRFTHPSNKARTWC